MTIWPTSSIFLIRIIIFFISFSLKNIINYIEDVNKFCISNRSNLIIYFKHYTDNKPSQINIINLDDMNILVTKNIYNISHIDLYWNDKKIVTITKRNSKNDIINIFLEKRKKCHSLIYPYDFFNVYCINLIDYENYPIQILW